MLSWMHCENFSHRYQRDGRQLVKDNLITSLAVRMTLKKRLLSYLGGHKCEHIESYEESNGHADEEHEAGQHEDASKETEEAHMIPARRCWRE